MKRMLISIIIPLSIVSCFELPLEDKATEVVINVQLPAFAPAPVPMVELRK